jgi:hypothetical protein
MNKYLFILATAFVLSGCDGGFLVKGNVVASEGLARPSNCTLKIIEPAEALDCCAQPIKPQGFEALFIVSPFDQTYKLSMQCAGFKPHVVIVRYGKDVSPSKPLELGTVVLSPAS